MEIKRYTGLEVEIDGNRLRLTGRNIYASRKGTTQFYILGSGAKQAGFRPNAWVIHHEGQWYLRRPGENGQRGNYRRREGRWETEVDAATPDQAAHLDAATIS